MIFKTSSSQYIVSLNFYVSNSWQVLGYKKNWIHHREKGPAVIYSNGTRFWHKKGKLHREDGPAIIWSSGSKSWYKHGKFIR